MACMEFQIIHLANNLELRHLFAVVEKPHSMLKYIHLIVRHCQKSWTFRARDQLSAESRF